MTDVSLSEFKAAATKSTSDNGGSSSPVTEEDLDWVYREVDPENTGFAKVNEFYKLITKNEAPKEHIEHTAMYIMGLFGTTKPGHLTRSEMAGYINMCKTGTRQDQYRMIFKDAGRRKPGLISRLEISDLIETKYNQILKPDLEDVFDNCDDDMDGYLTMEEFVKFIEIYEL